MTAPTSDTARPNAASTRVREREALVPRDDQCAAQRARAERQQLLAVIRHRILDDLARQRGDDGGDEDRLGHHHGGGREENTRASPSGPARDSSM